MIEPTKALIEMVLGVTIGVSMWIAAGIVIHLLGWAQ